MDLDVEQIASDIINLLIQPNTEPRKFKEIEDRFESNYDKLSSYMPKEQLLDSVGTFAVIKLFRGLKAKDELKVLTLKEFRNYLNKSDKIEINQKRSFSLKGFYYFFQGDFKQSVKYFDNARDIDPYYLPHILGKGLVEYQRKDYRSALGYFKQVFQFYRHVVPKSAYIMGLCYLNINKLELAEKCFNYMIKHNLGNLSENHAGIAIIKQKLSDVDGYYQALVGAFRSSSTVYNVNTALGLAEHYFFKKDFDKTAKLTKIGIKLADDIMSDYKNFDKSGRNDYNELRSRLSYMLGFIEQSKANQEGLTEAYKLYKSALQSNSMNYAAQFGLAQILYYQRNYTEANECLEIITTKLPEHVCRDCYTLIPHVLMRLNKEQKAYEAFDKVMKYFPNNQNVLVDYVSYLEVSNPKKALATYEKILECSTEDKLEPEILNNMAVTFIQNKNYEKALSILERAKSALNSNTEDVNKLKALNLIVDYNIARIYHKQHLISRAISIYKDIIDKNPLFYECYLHIASIHAQNQDTAAFNDTINTALYICYKTLSASKIEFPFYLQVTQLIKNSSFNEALDHMSKIKRQDTFILLFRATVLYNFVAHNRSNVNEAKKHIRHAAELCSMILRNKEETNNIYAANMVGCLLAERGRINDSLKIFHSFQDVVDINSPLLYNLALAEYIAGNYEKGLIIIESPKSYYKLKYEIVCALMNLMVEKYAQAEKVLKYRYLREPSLASLYNYVACLHKRIKDLFTKKEAKIEDVDILKENLTFCEKVFNFINHAISPKVATALNNSIDKAEIERRKFFDLKKHCEKQVFFLQQNQENYHKMMEKELEKRQQIKASQENRRYIMELKANEVTREVQQIQQIQLSKEELMELRAKEAMKMAESMMQDIKVQQLEIRQPAKKIKKEKVRSDDDDEDNIPIAKDKKAKRVSKKIQKKKPDSRIKYEESDEDSFIAGNISESEESRDEKPYEEGDFSDDNSQQAVYDPLHNYVQNEKKGTAAAQPERRRLIRKDELVARKRQINSESEIDEKLEVDEDNRPAKDVNKQPHEEEMPVKNVNEDIYVTKHRPNKKLFMDDEDE